MTSIQSGGNSMTAQGVNLKLDDGGDTVLKGLLVRHGIAER